MPKSSEHCVQARSLRADLLAAPTVWVPRRDIIVEWLNGFLQRAEKPSYALGETEAADLSALEQFLRKRDVPLNPH